MDFESRWPHLLAVAVVSLSLLVACTSDAVINDPCGTKGDCDGLHPDAVCYESQCTLYCDIEERVCLEREGTVCVRQEIRYRLDPFADDSCETLGGECGLRVDRTVCQ